MLKIDEIAYIYNALPTASIVLKGDAPHFTIVAANGAFLKSTHKALSELIGKNFFDEFPKDIDDENGANEGFLKVFEQVLETKEACQIKRYKYTPRNTTPDSTCPVFWKIEVYLLLDQFGEVEYIVQSWEDITHIAVAENALKSSNELYEYVNKATDDAIYDWDIVENHLEWGEAFSRVFGYRRGSGKFPIEKWLTMLHPDDIETTRESLASVLRSKVKIKWTMDYRLKKASGEYLFVQENGYVVRNKEGTAIRMIGVLRDVTQRINYIHTIEQRNLRLRNIAWAQTHLVRAPLASILGLVQLLYDPGAEVDTDDRQLLSYLDVSAKELDKVIKGIIDQSRI